ncbi:thioredoxin domain-containing protein [Cellulomonas massiliensis]|uniref:thioredoxin domain-containing protein n=1 Tax=Cellulomonas massiliensis TaxID=1465811 RepID=UPI0002DDF4F4|nr:thioredoxin domain-containing protein [Cellulomonas massiliensis]
MPNRLASATSPYLLQHAENPVDWREWGPDAFAEAAHRDVPVLVSIGYAACHWCHVMAHESFEDERVAAFMNEHLVCVKVDREERPDVDAVYMAATQALTGQGGWPMTVFTTPTGEPLYCGTYFPPRRVGHMPSFSEVLAAVAAAWRERRDEVTASAARIAAALAEPPGFPPAPGPDEAMARRAVDQLASSFDERHGGFGGAPKFPPSTVLEWLVRRYARTGDERAWRMAATTLEALARGGIHDQLAGGFARYSVDATWTVPHFEKMLDDNAMLLSVAVHAWRAGGGSLARDVAERTAGWLVAELGTPEGGFASSLDADSPGGEGAAYVWTPAQLREVLGDDDAAWAASLLGVTDEGTFEAGASVLTLAEDPPDVARWQSVRARLLAARSTRPQPSRDDKVVTAWNGWAVAALAEAGAVLDEPRWVHAAQAAARLLTTTHTRRDDRGRARLVRASRHGVPGSAPAVLEDYAATAVGLLALAAVTGDQQWTLRAGELLETVLELFADDDGALYDTASDETDAVLAAVGRPRDAADGPTPSGPAAAAGALLTYAALTGSVRHREAAEAALRPALAVAAQHPRAGGWALAVVEAMLDGPREVAVIGAAGDEGAQELRAAALRSPAPGLVLAVGSPGDVVPELLRDRPLVDGRAAAYVCRGFVCERPTTSAQELAEQLAARP